MPRKLAETDLYPPVKALLESQGYEVKGEVGPADVVACRADEPPVIVELKTGFSLTLFHQAIARQSITDAVYVAVPHGKGRPFLRSLKANRTLCRRLGIGLITIRPADGHCQIHLDPAPYRPRHSPQRKSRLLREFARREGDPNPGGTARQPLVTAYRQDAMRIAAHLCEHGPSRGADVARETSVDQATRMMAADHYGWFERVERGVYRLTEQGQRAVQGMGN